jgi:hypothetical protein
MKMVGKIMLLVVSSALYFSLASNGADAFHGITSSQLDAEAMEAAFLRSEKVHAESIAKMMTTMSTEKAWNVLAKNNLTNPALVEVAKDLQGKNTHLRKQPKGYAGLDGARVLLNDMIFESMSKYDAEIAKCTEYYSTQCAAMKHAVGRLRHQTSWQRIPGH